MRVVFRLSDGGKAGEDSVSTEHNTSEERTSPRSSRREHRGLRILCTFVLFALIIFLPAGRLNWWDGWAFLIFFFLAVFTLTRWMGRKDPDLFKERRRRGKNVKSWDKKIIKAYNGLSLALILTAGLDGGRFGWAPVSTPFKVLGWAGVVSALSLIWRVMSTNTYLSSMVRIQDDRGHRVVTSGPYRFVRHPMYVGVVVAVLCLPLVLGSWWAMVPGGLIAVLFFVRTALEDRMLHAELEGYEAYARKTRFRLVPGIW